MTEPRRFDRTLGLTVLVLLLVGCLAVLAPFLTGLLLAVILAYATWPLNLRLRKSFGGRKTLAALALTLAATLLLLGPFVILALSLADNATQFADAVRSFFEEGLPDLPAWLTGLPLVGEALDTYWQSFAHDGGRLMEEAKTLISPARTALLSGGGLIAGALLQLGLAILVAFFLYR